MSAVDKAKTVIPNTPIEFDVPSLPAPSGNGLPGWPYMSYTNLHSLNLDWVIAMIKAYGDYMYAVQQALLEWTGETNDLLQQLIDTVNKWGDQISYIIDKLPESTVDELLGILDTVQEHTSEINALITDVSGLKAADATLGQRIDTLYQQLTQEVNDLNGLIAKADADIAQVQSNLQTYVTSNNAALATTNEQVEKNRQDILTLSGGVEGELARIQALETSQTQQDTKISSLEVLTSTQSELITTNTHSISNINTVNEQQNAKITNLTPVFINYNQNPPFTLDMQSSLGTLHSNVQQYMLRIGEYYNLVATGMLVLNNPISSLTFSRFKIDIPGFEVSGLSAQLQYSYRTDGQNSVFVPSGIRTGDGGIWIGFSIDNSKITETIKVFIFTIVLWLRVAPTQTRSTPHLMFNITAE